MATMALSEFDSWFAPESVASVQVRVVSLLRDLATPICLPTRSLSYAGGW